MSTYIVASIIILLSALACYALISQAIEKRRIQKQRILMTLQAKHRNFVHMISGIPQNFLPIDLITLIYRALIHTCEQLNRIEPNNIRYQNEISLYSSQLSTLNKNNASQSALLENPEQMKEVRQHLQELQRFVLQQEALKTINKLQAKSYLDQIKGLSLQMVVDTYAYHTKQAQQEGKTRLAIHYLTLTKKLLTSENTTHHFDKQIAQLNITLAKLEEKALASDESKLGTDSVADQAAKEWDSFNKKEQENADWKKKQIYD
ncbi:MAG: hypothetical protein V4732_12465 [Pseudomonadota bacterium]